SPTAYRMQLLDLPPLRHALGVLQLPRRRDHREAGRDGGLPLGRQTAALRALQALRLRYALGRGRAASGWKDGRQHSQLRSGGPGRRARSPARRRENVEVAQLTMACACPDGFLAAPPAGVGPGVLVLHAWWGLNETLKAFCKRLANSGFVAFAPDLY